jgi:3-hydroxybutyryl-CoA dehydrogenase
LEQLLEHFDNTLPKEVPILIQSVDVSLSEILMWAKNPQRIVGFDGLFFAQGTVVTLVAHPELQQKIAESVDQIIYSLGKLPVCIKESPGLVLPRILFMLTNEAAFAELEGVADGETIDLAMKLGVNYPKGPLEWGGEFGLDKVVKVLGHLREEYGEDRYRTCVRLRQQARI